VECRFQPAAQKNPENQQRAVYVVLATQEGCTALLNGSQNNSLVFVLS
jgi:hypothetical protein